MTATLSSSFHIGCAPAGDVDDGKPAVAEENRMLGVGVEAFAVGAAMRERLRHRRNVGSVAGSGETRQAAHHSILISVLTA